MLNSSPSDSNAIALHRVFELVDYNPNTGDFRWRAKRPRCRPGSKAGCIDKSGYLRLRLDDQQYKAGHIAWFYVFGTWPPGPLRYADRDKTNNAINNLFVASAPDHRPEKLGLAALPKFLRDLERRNRAEAARKRHDDELRARIRAFARSAGKKA